MENKTKTKEIDIHCACAIGDLSEMAEVKPVKKTQTKVSVKDLKKDNTYNKKHLSNSKK
jgi:hypothetical protein